MSRGAAYNLYRSHARRAAVAATAMIAGLAALACHASARVVEAINPRPFGYFLGDRVERTITVIADPGEELILSALPQIGPQTYWLDLVDEKTTSKPLDGGRTQTRIELVYQIFYSALEPRPMELPGISLQFNRVPASGARVPPDGGAQTQVAVPPFPIIVSPIREIVLNDINSDNADKSPVEAMRADRPAQLLTAEPWRTTAAASTLALALAGLGLAWHYAVWPFDLRRGRPFARAWSTLAKLEDSPVSTNDSYRAALVTLHRAFDECAGYRLFAGETATFLDKHHEYAASRDMIEEFFKVSRLTFFGDDITRAAAEFPRQRITELASRLAQEERAAL